MSTTPTSTPSGAATADLCLPATPAAATQARHALAALTPDSALREEGRLLVTEAVANAIEHTDTAQIHVLLRHEAAPEQRLLCAVRDTSTTSPAWDPAGGLDPDAEDGRGLHLIDALAESWGYLPDDHGKWLWFSVTLDATTSPTAA